MARVYLALSQKQFGFTKLVVLKVLRDELDADGEFIDMFIQEAKLAARLNHPNVVQTYEVGEEGGRHYIAMEYLEGQPLSTVIARVGAANLPLEFQVRVICDALEGLHYAHELTDFDGTELGLVHRDVSPQNVFVTYTGQSKILDFGIAKTSSSVRTTQGVIKGKTGYMAPEQATFGNPDRRTDLFAVGVMLWEAIARRRLVQRTDDDVVSLTRRISGLDPPIRAVVPDAPPLLADICDKAMAKDPNHRYATAKEFREALEAYLVSTGKPFDARHVAALLDETFAEERTRIRRLVDEQAKVAGQSAGPLLDIKGEGTVTPPSRVMHADVVDATSPLPTSPKAFSATEIGTGPTVRPKRTSRVVFAVVGVLAVGGIAAGVLAKSSTRKPPEPTMATSTPAVTSATTADTEPATYKLTLTSEPSGARVYEGDAMVGQTPFNVVLTNSALRTSPRHFLIKQEGFEPFRVDPVPSHEDVSTKVTLVSSSAASAKPPVAPPPVFVGRPPVQPPRPTPKDPATATEPQPTAQPTRPLGVEPPDPRGLRPLDNANPWEKKK